MPLLELKQTKIIHRDIYHFLLKFLTDDEITFFNQKYFVKKGEILYIIFKSHMEQSTFFLLKVLPTSLESIEEEGNGNQRQIKMFSLPLDSLLSCKKSQNISHMYLSCLKRTLNKEEH